ncbi:unnamed protein product [Macrosiphum euphorbiae]|uniref:Secreted protein n=1 Tax=Macrosiphum euphorbiae TaxID=13131 RepID=A0AAV0XML1_9HEMI|nr:unnamed protein product [Macrosiphum euphorbiae]
MRMTAVRRSLNFVFTVALPRPIVITTSQIASLGPVPVTRILPPQSIEIFNVVEGRSVRPEALSADDDSGDQLEGASVKKRTKRRFAAFRRRLLKIGRRLCCWYAALTVD